MVAANKKQWLSGISWWRIEQAINNRSPVVVIKNILWMHREYNRSLFRSSMLKDSIPLLRGSNAVVSFFGSLICPHSRENNNMVINANTTKMGKSWLFPGNVKYSQATLPKCVAIIKIISWSPRKVPAKEAYGKWYFFFKYVDVANDPDLKKILFKMVFIEDIISHSPLFRRTPKQFAMRFSLDPLRAMPKMISKETEKNCEADKSRTI